MLLTFLEALLKAALPVAAVTLVMVYWALLNGYLAASSDHAELQKQLKAMAKDKKKSKQKQPGSFLHRKWVKFGGGFYGVIALMTYAVVEWDEVRGFFAGFEGFRHFFAAISIDLVINFFIDSLMNFVTAISWPAYWVSRIDSVHIWVWFVAAYLGYLGGSRAAQHFYFDESAQ